MCRHPHPQRQQEQSRNGVGAVAARDGISALAWGPGGAGGMTEELNEGLKETSCKLQSKEAAV